MKKIPQGKLLSILENDFHLVLNEHPFLLEIDKVDIFTHHFINKWETFLKKHYVSYPSILYTLSHSYHTVYAIGEKVESLFLQLNRKVEIEKNNLTKKTS